MYVWKRRQVCRMPSISMCYEHHAKLRFLHQNLLLAACSIPFHMFGICSICAIPGTPVLYNKDW